MTALADGVSPGWLALREAADARARSADLVAEILGSWPVRPLRPVRICDLGCGTGSTLRWLAPRLPGPQHWRLLDRDPALLEEAALLEERTPVSAADGAPVVVETLLGDVTRLRHADLDDVALVTASALLDVLTEQDVQHLAARCVRAGCPALLTLTVTGRVRLHPGEAFDRAVQDAFNAHQRRGTGGRRLLGPDASAVAAGAFSRLGARVIVRDSPWRLGPAQPTLLREWLIGWVGAARTHRPDLDPAAEAYLRRRLAQAACGALEVNVHHQDLLARPARDHSGG